MLQIRACVVLVLATVMLASGGALAQTPAGAATALAGRFPTEFAGNPLDVSTMDGQAWIDAWFDAMPPEGAGLDALLTARQRPLGDLVVADAFFETSQDAAEILAFQLPGLPAAELVDAIIPLLTLGYADRLRTEVEVLGRPIIVVSDGPPDMESGWLMGVHLTDDVVWAVWATGSELTEVVEAVIDASSAPAEPPASSAPVAEGPTVSAVILADVAEGTIDEATGLLYRVYAISGDPGLPDRYAAYPVRDDDTAFDDAAFRYASLPDDIQDALAPYVVRPTDERSIYHEAEAPSAARPAMAALLTDQVPCAQGDWSRRASSSIPMVVWDRCDVASGTRGTDATLAALEGLYPDMVKLMGKPILDAGGAADGGDSSIDVYLVSKLATCPTDDRRATCIPGDAMAVARAAPPFGPGPAGTSSGYLVLDRTRAAAGGPAFVSDVAHELFHLFQAAYNRRGLAIASTENHWFVEASAVWAEHHFVPEARASQVYPRLRSFQGYHSGLTSTFGTREYDAYLWPYFMEQERGAPAIADAWDAIRGQVGEEALDTAIASVVSFETRYREFAVRAWNAALPAEGGGDAVDPRFQALDAAMPQLKPGEERWVRDALYAQTREAEPIEVPQWVDTLGHFYREYAPTDEVKQLIVDFTGLVPAADLDVEALLRRRDGTWERRPLPHGETTFCLDPSGDDLDRLILVFANHSYLQEVDGTFTVRPLADPCALWEGTMSEHQRWNKGGSKGDWTATFHGRWEPTPPDLSYCDEDCVSLVPVGTIDWRSDSAYKGTKCAVSQSGSVSAGDVITPTDQMLFLARDDEDHLRYWGFGTLFLDLGGCAMQDGTGKAGPDGFFWIQDPDQGAPRSDEDPGDRPNCALVTWRIERGADTMAGTCWLDDLPGFERWVDWDLRRVGAEVAPG